MHRVGLLAVLVCGACHKDPVEPGVDAASGDRNVSGMLSQSDTWSGTIHLTGATTIPDGVTIEVAAGTTILASSGASITLAGTFDAEGASGSKITIKPAASAWSGFVNVTGTLIFHYVDLTGGGIIAVPGGNLTIIDTTLVQRPDGRDFLTMDGSTLDMEYSTINPGTGTMNHCDFHFDGNPNTIKIVHTNISDATNGTDFYSGTADFTYNNWFTNAVDVYTQPGSPVSADVSFSWFQHGAPTAAAGSTITAGNLAGAKLTDAGPRP
jgi:hypothetical protein